MPAMSESKNPPSESDMRLAQDLLFFAYRDFTNAADVALAELGLGRAHHRALFFIGRNPGISLSDLLAILRIPKQSPPRLPTPPAAGGGPERKLSARQRARLGPAWQQAGPDAVAGFRAVMRAIMDDAARAYVDARDGKPAVGWRRA